MMGLIGRSPLVGGSQINTKDSRLSAISNATLESNYSIALHDSSLALVAGVGISMSNAGNGLGVAPNPRVNVFLNEKLIASISLPSETITGQDWRMVENLATSEVISPNSTNVLRIQHIGDAGGSWSHKVNIGVAIFTREI